MRGGASPSMTQRPKFGFRRFVVRTWKGSRMATARSRLRGAAIARVALASRKMFPPEDIKVMRVNFRKGGWCYFMLDAADLVEQHSLAPAQHPVQADVQRALLDCVSEDHRCPADVFNDSLRNARFTVARDCLDALIHVARRMPDPLPLLSQLPRDWQALYVVRHLVAAGQKEPSLLRYAKQACDDHPNVVFCQAAHERDLCRNELERCGEAVAAPPRSPIERLFSGDAEPRRFARSIDSEPGSLLEVLNGTVRDPFDLPMLYDWKAAAQSWQGLLFARLFRRMFVERPLRRVEVEQLVEHVLAVVEALPPSALRTEYQTVYGAIREMLVGRAPTAIELPDPGSPIQRSHGLAAMALIRAAEAQRKAEDGRWLVDLLCDRRGWWETTNCELKDGSMSRGGGLYLICFFPAVRLAFAAIGFQVGLRDPAACYMRRRRRAAKIIKEHEWRWSDRASSQERLVRGLSNLEEAATEMPDDERLTYCCGNLLLRLDRLPEAEERLQRSMSLPSCDAAARTLALYDLACIYARRGEEDRCRTALEEADGLHPLNRKWLAQDPDLASVREQPWFRVLLTNAAAP